MSVAAVRPWESGIIPLFAVPYGQLQQLAQALDRTGTQAGVELNDILLASRCDLLLMGMLYEFEDYAEVPPIEEQRRSRQCPQPASMGADRTSPDRYRQYVPPRRLLNKEYVDLVAAIANDLHAGSYGADLAGFGSVLAALAGR